MYLPYTYIAENCKRERGGKLKQLLLKNQMAFRILYIGMCAYSLERLVSASPSQQFGSL